MPIPPSEIARYRADMRDLSDLALADLEATWAQLPHENADETRDALADLLPEMVTGAFLAAAATTADWYDLQRLEAELRGSFVAIIPDPPETVRFTKLAGWAVGPLYSALPDPVTALSKLSGGVQRSIVDGGRQTITASAVADPAAGGWTRVGTGRCDYCRTRIGIQITSDVVFKSHDACGCVAVPAF